MGALTNKNQNIIRLVPLTNDQIQQLMFLTLDRMLRLSAMNKNIDDPISEYSLEIIELGEIISTLKPKINIKYTQC